ncbi:HD domain containing protein [Tritrichomonas foetus]|uniref:HD domain containing protein n=1 Tax=Tritrichomonas foetus TaxID=1144522 RepID=A0A1J4JCH0_9EUKA|nr:HD domain containing protein [Tritrichomonas foetus]|eukprot:OHS95109.1 HD domain containing protein [Tritrichomonas foetus]
MTVRAHSPQDELYGPLDIPSYCWSIIDTPEYQRMRYIPQLGCASFIFPGATHTRFEHCLGCAHLAKTFLEHISRVQPEIELKDEYWKAVIIAALTHDIGHGPWSHCFEAVAAHYSNTWDHEEMSCMILKHIIKKYNIPIDSEVIEASCYFIRGEAYPKYPPWLSRIVANKDCDIDLDKFDYLARDMNRSLCIARFEYDRLIFHCKVVENQLAWKISEISTIERMFFNRNDMHQRVYQHRVNQAYRAMVLDMLEAAEPFLNIKNALDDPEAFCKLDCRLQYLIELGQCGEEAKRISELMSLRKVYKCIGEIRINPDNDEGLNYSQLPSSQLADDIALYAGIDASKLRVVKMQFRYGLKKDSHPLLSIPFWKPGSDKIFKLTIEDISCIVPAYFAETGMRVFVTDPDLVKSATSAFEKWKKDKGLI